MNTETTQKKYPVSVIVITHDEERNINKCLRSVLWADEIIVVDSKSTDKTVEYAKTYTGKVFVTEFLGYAGAKNFALDKVTNGWTLWLDADERIPPELAEEMQSIISGNSPEYIGYEVARRAFFLGKWIRHCGWYPGYVVRLFKTKGARFNDALVHECVMLDGNTGRMHHDLLHYTDDNLFHYFAKFNNYTSLAADDLASANRRFSLYDILVHPPFLFLKMYILRLGFLDGLHGFVLSALSAMYVFTKYAKLWEKQRSAK